jgi:DNA gyrase subunit A
MTTKYGLVKKVDVADFANVRRNGLIAIKLKDNDRLQWVEPTTGKDEIILATNRGQSIRFMEKDAREMGRNAAGVRGIRLKGDDFVVNMAVIDPALSKKEELLTVGEHGYGKRTSLNFYKIQRRGGSGIRAMKVSPKTGKLVCGLVVNAEDLSSDLMVISKKGQVIRLPLKSISSLGRDTQGVRLMKFRAENDSAARISLVEAGEEKK